MKPRRDTRHRKPPKITLLSSLLKKGVIWLVNNPLIVLASLVASFISLTEIKIPDDGLVNIRYWIYNNPLSALIIILVTAAVFGWASSPINEEESRETDNFLNTVPEKPSMIIIYGDTEQALQILTKVNQPKNLPDSEIPTPRISPQSDIKVIKISRATHPVISSARKTSRK